MSNGIDQQIEKFKTDPLEYKRQTGRSMRMMLAAAQLASDGQKVLVTFKDEASANHWRQKFGGIPTLTIKPMHRDTEIDWQTLKIKGVTGYDSQFLDHDVIWAYNKAIFAAFNRYDLPMDRSPYLLPEKQPAQLQAA